MNNLAKKAELYSNIAIIFVAVLLAGALVKRFLSSVPSQKPSERVVAQKVPESGDSITLADVDWRKNGKTLLLAVSTTCHFCTQSGPFYQRLVKEQGEAQLIALVPQSVEEGRDYMKKLGVDINDVRQVSFRDLGVSGTPTLILIDNDGKVVETWLGALTSEKENEVVSRLHAERASR